MKCVMATPAKYRQIAWMLMAYSLIGPMMNVKRSLAIADLAAITGLSEHVRPLFLPFLRFSVFGVIVYFIPFPNGSPFRIGRVIDSHLYWPLPEYRH
jgi:hypothetical protein